MSIIEGVFLQLGAFVTTVGFRNVSFFLVNIHEKVLAYAHCAISERKQIEHNAILIIALKLVYDSYEKPRWLRDALRKKSVRYSYL